jgi:hypothetical protein
MPWPSPESIRADVSAAAGPPPPATERTRAVPCRSHRLRSGVCVPSSSISSLSDPGCRRSTHPPPPMRASSSMSRPPGCAAAIITRGPATMRRSLSPMCPGMSWSVGSPRWGPCAGIPRRPAGDRSIRVRVRDVPVVRFRQCAGVPRSDAAGIHAFRVVGGSGRHPQCRREPRGRARGSAGRGGGRARVSFRHGLPRAARAGSAGRGETVAVFGCGGVGLSAIMIARALGAKVVAVDVSDAALESAREFGAAHDASMPAISVRRISAPRWSRSSRRPIPDGVAVTVDALGREDTIRAAIGALAPLGRHVQIGLLPAEPVVDLPRVIALELSVLGSHGMAAAEYPGARRPRRPGAAAAAGPRHQRHRPRRGTRGDGGDGLPAASAGMTIIDLAR